ncbi:hypothetical protein [Bailinhaonella thermotolerans]|uniref:Uncharacterized protein n=1 Tax=Bailinhaonella thermotolerans TaxID=1070861 RepID=A0A3A4A474_9ACTN|nr:hypothetical protein [Bailinhaonella thermotolerans]RJL23295.1 hypothetical protein D5H75_33585 [Bailinhaonella thermotolerans]
MTEQDLTALERLAGRETRIYQQARDRLAVLALKWIALTLRGHHPKAAAFEAVWAEQDSVQETAYLTWSTAYDESGAAVDVGEDLAEEFGGWLSFLTYEARYAWKAPAGLHVDAYVERREAFRFPLQDCLDLPLPTPIAGG